MKTILKEDLVFRPLPHANWIGNAVLPIKPGILVSVSKDLFRGPFCVGSDDNYEVAIQAFESGGQEADLVWLDNRRNVACGCDMDEVNALVAKANEMVYAGRIEIFDLDRIAEGEHKWLRRFFCVEGLDFDKKIEYARRVWGDGCWRVIPAL